MSKEFDPKDIPQDEFMREGYIDRLAQYLESAPDAWHLRYNLAVALVHHGRLDEALEHFKGVLQYVPKHMESLVNMGGIHLSRGDADQAMRAFTTALSVWDVPVVRANLAVAYMQKDRLDEALQNLEIALAAQPDMPDALANLANIKMRQGKPEEAVTASLKAIELHDGFAIAYNNLAAAYLELGDRESAKEAAAKALDLGYPVPEDMLSQVGL